MKKRITKFYHKHLLVFKVIPFVLLVLSIKLAMHFLNWEYFEMSPLIPAIISADVFLLGFLLNGVLSDYKESEKYPSELMASIDAMADEALIIYANKKDQSAKDFVKYLLGFSISLREWFHKRERTEKIMKR